MAVPSAQIDSTLLKKGTYTHTHTQTHTGVHPDLRTAKPTHTHTHTHSYVLHKDTQTHPTFALMEKKKSDEKPS